MSLGTLGIQYKTDFEILLDEKRDIPARVGNAVFTLGHIIYK